MSESNHAVVNESEERAQFACGHEGAARFAHSIFGRVYLPRENVLADREKCGACLLAAATEGITRCARCERPIFKGEDCIMYSYGLCCLSTNCGTGPLGDMPGIWDGERFVDGITAGTVKLSR